MIEATMYAAEPNHKDDRTDEPESCFYCGSLYPMPRLMAELSDGSVHQAWICEDCGYAHFSRDRKVPYVE